jgi:hypothetical protein
MNIAQGAGSGKDSAASTRAGTSGGEDHCQLGVSAAAILYLTAMTRLAAISGQLYGLIRHIAWLRSV